MKTDVIEPQNAQAPSGRERRQHPRYLIQSDALAFVGTEPGTIIDMSEGGLAVRFVSMQKNHTLPQELDLFHPQSNLYLQHLPVAVVNEVTSSPHSIFSTLTSRRYCIQFGPLSNQQQAMIRTFIHDCCQQEH